MKVKYQLIPIILMLLMSCKENKTAGKKAETTVTAKIESELDKVKLSELDNTAIDLNQYKGKTIFINFWATWCGPCLEEMPSIQKAQEKLKDKDIVYLFASDEAVEQIEKFKKKHPYTFHYVKADNMESLNIMALPTTYIFNPEGKLVFSEMGYRKWDDKSNLNIIIKAAK